MVDTVTGYTLEGANDALEAFADTLSDRYGTVFMATEYGAVLNGTTDDGPALQAALDAARTAGGGTVLIPRKGSGILATGQKIFHPANVRLELAPGVTLKRRAGLVGTMLTNDAFTPLRSVADAAITALSTTLTSATGAFTSADIGRSVFIAGAGTAAGTGGIKGLYTTIASVTNGTTVVLSLAAVTSVSGAAASIYTRDRNISLVGGPGSKIDGGSIGAPAGTGVHHVVYRRVDHITVSGLYGTCVSSGKYLLNLGDVTDYSVTDIEFLTYSDGVHINGPATRGEIKRITGYTTDDSVAFTGMDYAVYSDVSGPIDRILVEDINTTTTGVSVKFTGASQQSAWIKDITVRRNSGLTNFTSDTGLIDCRGYAVFDSCYRLGLDATGGTVQSVVVQNSTFIPTSNSQRLVSLSGTFGHVAVSGITQPPGGAYSGTHAVFLNANTTVSDLNISDVRWYASGGSTGIVSFNAATCTVTNLRITRAYLYGAGGGQFVAAQTAGNVVTNLHVTDCEAGSTAWIADLAGTTNVFLNGVNVTVGFKVRATGVVTVYTTNSVIGSSTVDSGGVLTTKYGPTASLMDLTWGNVPGRWVKRYTTGGSTGLVSNHTWRLMTFPVFNDISLEVLGINNLTVVGAAGSLIRLAVYACDSGGKPSTLVADLGTIDTSITTGVRTITGLDVKLSPGMYAFGAQPQGSPVTNPTVQLIHSNVGGPLVQNHGSAIGETYGANGFGWAATGGAGAAASSVSGSVTPGDTIPVFVWKWKA